MWEFFHEHRQPEGFFHHNFALNEVSGPADGAADMTALH